MRIVLCYSELAWSRPICYEADEATLHAAIRLGELAIDKLRRLGLLREVVRFVESRWFTPDVYISEFCVVARTRSREISDIYVYRISYETDKRVYRRSIVFDFSLIWQINSDFAVSYISGNEAPPEDKLLRRLADEFEQKFLHLVTTKNLRETG